MASEKHPGIGSGRQLDDGECGPCAAPSASSRRQLHVRAALCAVVGLAVGTLLPTPWRAAARWATERASTGLLPTAGHSQMPEVLASPRLAVLAPGMPVARDVGRARPVQPAHSHKSESTRLSASEIGQRALRASVFVRVGSTYGAGVMLDRGIVLTCGHVLDSAEARVPIEVERADGQTFEATLIERDAQLDLALVALANDASDAQPAVASSDSVSLGDEVFAMGAPKRMAFSLHRGMVSFVGREFEGVRYLQTDLPTNGGNSGGPVLNDRGEIIAIASFILRDSQGIAFALPIETALSRFATHLGSTHLRRGRPRAETP